MWRSMTGWVCSSSGLSSSLPLDIPSRAVVEVVLVVHALDNLVAPGLLGSDRLGEVANLLFIVSALDPVLASFEFFSLHF